MGLKRLWVGVVVLVVWGIWWWWPRPSLNAPEVPVERVERAAAAPRQVRSPERVQAEEPEPVETSAEVNRAIAEAFGLTAIRCYVGTTYDGRYDPSFFAAAFVRDGWLEAVVEEPAGARVMDFIWFPLGTDTHEGLRSLRTERSFQVLWDAAEGEAETACTVAPVAHSTLVLDVDLSLVPDAYRELIPPMAVTFEGCGSIASSSEFPFTVEVESVALAHGCTLRGSFWRWTGDVYVEPVAPDEVRQVAVFLDQERPDYEKETASDADLEHEAHGIEGELLVLRALLARSEEGTSARRHLSNLVGWRESRVDLLYDEVAARKDGAEPRNLPH